ncbi:MAG: ABC transporter permease [Chitinophagales bacterium]
MNRKRLIRTAIFIFIIAITGGLITYAANGSNFLITMFNIFLLVIVLLACFFVLYSPVIYLLRRWWKKRSRRFDMQKDQRAIAMNKFINNGNALTGAITIIYAVLLSLFAHLIAPDITPFANDQINELAFKPPGFSIQVLKQPLELETGKTNFFRWIVNGKKLSYRQIPVTNYQIKNDSIYVERYIGDGIKGQQLQFSLNDIKDGENKNDDSVIETRKFLFGTDDLGRDYLSRIILGVRVSLSVGVVAVIIALFIGIPLGAFAGFYKRFPPKIKLLSKSSGIFVPVDNIIMWLINIIWAIPTLLLVFPIVFAFGQNFYTIFIAVGLTMWVDIARIVRGQVMQVREFEFIQAAKTFGFSDMRTIFRHVIPNIMGPIIVITAANFAYAILTEAGLSFLGIGVQPPAPSWGLMISKYKDNLITEPYLALIPGFAITILVLAFFMVGNGLRDALDVRTKFN